MKVVKSQPGYAGDTVKAQVTVFVTLQDVLQNSDLQLHLLIADRLNEARRLLLEELGFEEDTFV